MNLLFTKSFDLLGALFFFLQILQSVNSLLRYTVLIGDQGSELSSMQKFTFDCTVGDSWNEKYSMYPIVIKLSKTFS